LISGLDRLWGFEVEPEQVTKRIYARLSGWFIAACYCFRRVALRL